MRGSAMLAAPEPMREAHVTVFAGPFQGTTTYFPQWRFALPLCGRRSTGEGGTAANENAPVLGKASPVMVPAGCFGSSTPYLLKPEPFQRASAIENRPVVGPARPVTAPSTSLAVTTPRISSRHGSVPSTSERRGSAYEKRPFAGLAAPVTVAPTSHGAETP